MTPKHSLFKIGDRVHSHDTLFWGTVREINEKGGVHVLRVLWDSGEELNVEIGWLVHPDESGEVDPNPKVKPKAQSGPVSLLQGQELCEVCLFLHTTAKTCKFHRIKQWARREFELIYGLPVDEVSSAYLHDLVEGWRNSKARKARRVKELDLDTDADLDGGLEELEPLLLDLKKERIT
jgi:hypothetical protein